MNESVTILAQRFWPEAHGGVETHMRHLATQLALLGCEVDVRTENRSGAPDREQMASNLQVRRYRPADPGRLWRWWPAVTVKSWRRSLTAEPPSGVIWASNPMLATGAILAGLSDQVIYNPAGCVAGMRSIGWMYPHVTSMRAPLLVEWFDRYAWRHSPAVVVSSDNVRSQFHRHYGLRGDVHVKPLAVSSEPTIVSRAGARRTWRLDAGAFVIGYVGRLDPCKGIDHLLDAFAHSGLRQSSRLLLVGDGPDRRRLNHRVAALGLKRHVIWTGRMQDPAQAYAAMDVLVLPSVYEAYGLVMVEAMGAGVPVLGRAGNGRTVLTASDEIIDDGRNGLIFDSHDRADLGRKLRLLESDPILRRDMGAAAKRSTFDQTWINYARGSIDLIVSISTSLRPGEVVRHAA